MIVFLIDADNLSAPAWIDDAFETILRSIGPITIRRAYGSNENLKGLSDVLRARGIRPIVNLPLSKNTTDLSLAVDAMELACQAKPPEHLIIGSGDMDFVPLALKLRERGIKVSCISERNKMAEEAVSFYDQVLDLDGEKIHFSVNTKRSLTPPANKVIDKQPKKVVAKKAATKAAPSPNSPRKKTAAKKSATDSHSSTVPNIQQILGAVPKLQEGQWLPLSEVAKSLHDGNVLGKKATSTKLFKKFSSHFELDPEKQPRRIRYLPQP